MEGRGEEEREEAKDTAGTSLAPVYSVACWIVRLLNYALIVSILNCSINCTLIVGLFIGLFIGLFVGLFIGLISQWRRSGDKREEDEVKREEERIDITVEEKGRR